MRLAAAILGFLLLTAGSALAACPAHNSVNAANDQLYTQDGNAKKPPQQSQSDRAG